MNSFILAITWLAIGCKLEATRDSKKVSHASQMAMTKTGLIWAVIPLCSTGGGAHAGWISVAVGYTAALRSVTVHFINAASCDL